MTLLSHAALDAARREGDPAGDRVIAELGADAWIVNAMLRHIHRNDDALPGEVPGVVSRFFGEEVGLPGWLDQSRVLRAQRWASRHLLPMTVALFCAALPTAYGAAKGARVLTATGGMQGGQLDRRVNETAQFVLDIVAEGGLGPSGCGLRAVQKVRLIHAAVRAQLTHRRLDLMDEIPINQEDMLGTLFTFSVVVVHALRRLGVPVDDDEADDYYHLWRAVGFMLGIREALLPSDFLSACDLAERVAARQLRGSEAGRALMAALLDGMEAHVGLPGLRLAPRYLVRYLVGDRLADDLGVPADNAFQSKLALLRLFPSVPSSPLASLLSRSAPALGRPLLEAVIAAKLRGAPASFAMPIEGRLREHERTAS